MVLGGVFKTVFIRGILMSIPGNSRKVLGIVEVRTYLVNLIQKLKERTEKQFEANIFHHFKSLLK